MDPNDVDAKMNLILVWKKKHFKNQTFICKSYNLQIKFLILHFCNDKEISFKLKTDFSNIGKKDHVKWLH